MTLTAVDAVTAIRALRPRRVIPVHTEGWVHFTEGPGTVARALAQAGLGELLLLPLAGVPIRI